jgi:hypothetical protein
MAASAFSIAEIDADAVVVKRVAASLQRLAATVGQPASTSSDGEPDFLAALEKAGA